MPENYYVPMRVNNQGELGITIFQVKSEISVTSVRALRATNWPYWSYSTFLTSPDPDPNTASEVPNAQGRGCPWLPPQPALLPGWGRWDRPCLPGSALVLTMGTPTAAPGTPAHRELSALTVHQQAENIKVFCCNLPLFSYLHTLNIEDTVRAYSSLISCC